MKPLRLGGRAALTATTLVASITAALLGLLAVLGGSPWSHLQEHMPKALIASAKPDTTIDTALTPAAQFVDRLTGLLAEQWSGRDLIERAQPPFPLSCTQEPGQAPVDSLSLTVAHGTRMQATVAVYPAGQGAVAIAGQLKNASSCASGPTSVWSVEVGGPGTEAFQVHTTWNGRSTVAHVWRQGDVLAYLVAAAGAPVSDAAAAMDMLITEALDERCVEPASSLADASRSPFSVAGYQPHSKKVRVRVDEAPLPPSPEGLQLTSPTAPMPAEQVIPVETPAVPDYPVWPPLPEPAPEPIAPQPPEPQVTSRTVIELVDDPNGPGCGWSFTGQVAPPFDEAAAAEQLEVDRTAALVGLQTGQSQWAQGVQDYWTAWAQYLDQVQTYEDYAGQVAEVAAAWNEIAEKWRGYRTEQAQFEMDMAAYEQELADRETAEATYQEQQTACTPPETADEPITPTEEPSDEPDSDEEEGSADETTEAASPDEPEAPEWVAPEFCPAQRPSSMDEPEPVEPVGPTPPADPRPLAEQD